jgi:hypothetical protein
VRVEKRVGVAEDLEVDAAERRIGGAASQLDLVPPAVFAVAAARPRSPR